MCGMVVRLRGVCVSGDGDLAVVVRCVEGAVDVVPLSLSPGEPRRWFRVSLVMVEEMDWWGGSFPELLPRGRLRWGLSDSGRSVRRNVLTEIHYLHGWNSTFVDWEGPEVQGRRLGDVSGEMFRVCCFRDMMCLLCRRVQGAGIVPADQEMGYIGRLFAVAAQRAGFRRLVPYLDMLLGRLFELEGMYDGVVPCEDGDSSVDDGGPVL